jgi:hypothetical protein
MEEKLAERIDPETVRILMRIIEAHAQSCVAQERARFASVLRPFVQLWEDGAVIDSAVLRRFVRDRRFLLE